MSFSDRLKKYMFEFRHFTVLFVVLIAFQGVLSMIHNSTLRTFLEKTQNWYQKDSAEKLGNVTATSLELLAETINPLEQMRPWQQKQISDALNIILSQELLGKNAKDICILISRGDKVYAIDDGSVLLSYLMKKSLSLPPTESSHTEAVELYSGIRDQLRSREEIMSVLQGNQTFHVFVPFATRGEYVGALYMKDAPDFGFITSSIISNYNETSVIYTSLILLGLLAMYYVSSYTVIERDKAHKLYIEEREKLVEEQTAHQKEFLFTKRIYHTHHKAEKVMAFVKEDLRLLTANNIDEIKYRISKYSNFISRVIYDMKWFDPPVQVFRGPRFNTSINEVIEFIVKNMFLRTSRPASNFSFKLEFDEGLPNVQINEFVIWEIVEPLIQNSIDHCGESHVTITLKTEFDPTSGESRVIVTDDGKGIDAELLERNAEGDQKLFMENVTTKKISGQNFGYGCYIAYDLATTRCGWKMFAENLPGRGCRFVIIIKN